MLLTKQERLLAMQPARSGYTLVRGATREIPKGTTMSYNNETRTNVNKMGISPLGKLTAARAGISEDEFASADFLKKKSTTGVREAEASKPRTFGTDKISPLGKLVAKQIGMSEEDFAKGPDAFHRPKPKLRPGELV